MKDALISIALAIGMFVAAGLGFLLLVAFYVTAVVGPPLLFAWAIGKMFHLI